MLKKNKIEEKAKKLALKDANGVQIDTTAEARSYLHARYQYWFKKLSI